jgi:hypothetical protein
VSCYSRSFSNSYKIRCRDSDLSESLHLLVILRKRSDRRISFRVNSTKNLRPFSFREPALTKEGFRVRVTVKQSGVNLP